jgi:hypothetical protein
LDIYTFEDKNAGKIKTVNENKPAGKKKTQGVKSANPKMDSD